MKSGVGRYSLSFRADFSGDELQRDKYRATSSSGRFNDRAAVPVFGANPSFSLGLSDEGRSATDDFCLNFAFNDERGKRALTWLDRIMWAPD